MYLANMDIKTTFDVARPKHIAKIMGDQEVHGWIAAALLRVMAGLKDKRPSKMLKAPCRSQDASVKGASTLLGIGSKVAMQQ